MYFPCILSFINAYLLCLSVEFSFGIDGAVMPSWFDIHEIPVTAVSCALLFASPIPLSQFFFTLQLTVYVMKVKFCAQFYIEVI